MRTYCASTLPFSPYPLTEFVGELAKGGITAIELAHTHYSDVEPRTIIELREKTGVKFKSLLSTVAVDSSDGLESLISILDKAQRLSIPIVSIASGGKEDATDEEIHTIIDLLRTVTTEAENRNITLALYAHEGSLAYNLEHTKQLLDAIPSDRFTFYYSPFHFHLAGDDPVTALQTLSERLSSVYFNCGVDSKTGSEPFWGPEMDFSAICKEIERVGYTDEIMLIYLGLNAETPQPIIQGVLNAREKLESYF
ncbi:sugar phosphate isomerase/epimerase [Candidatus Poribacteria bacterium]|nr:sugar phosphate isomerase/epimerase [Candidatus Poribacteria bacterium]